MNLVDKNIRDKIFKLSDELVLENEKTKGVQEFTLKSKLDK